ncbi:MAG: helix-turn-helix transcriptional regulator [Chloroflexi bacterium]|nr:helix-turn-helix transcriptional regulator [Chloroflexota bacterium]MBP8057784.1 helix-turn-helix transcriptional regulator [Chloroflexota bacterium]
MNTNTPPDPFAQQADYFKALAHPVRLQILTILRQGEACVCHLEAILHKRQAYISQQVSVLKEAGLLAERKDGLFVFYRLANSNLVTLLEQTLAFAQAQTRTEIPLFVSPMLAAVPCSCPTCKPLS